MAPNNIAEKNLGKKRLWQKSLRVSHFLELQRCRHDRPLSQNPLGHSSNESALRVLRDAIEAARCGLRSSSLRSRRRRLLTVGAAFRQQDLQRFARRPAAVGTMSWTPIGFRWTPRKEGFLPTLQQTTPSREVQMAHPLVICRSQGSCAPSVPPAGPTCTIHSSSPTSADGATRSQAAGGTVRQPSTTAALLLARPASSTLSQPL